VLSDSAQIGETASCFLHDYGKSARPGRKLGHVTVIAHSPAERDSVLKKLSNLLNP